MTDDELIGYTDLHSRTDRALFNDAQINRMHELAGKDFRVPVGSGWYSWHYEYAKPVIAAARARAKK